MDDPDTTDHRALGNRRSRHLSWLIVAAAIMAAAAFFVWGLSMIDV